MDPRAGAQVTSSLVLVSPLRTGAMGAVWVAEHLELGTRVAVKFVSSQGMNEDPESARRLKLEAEAACEVDSEHVVRVIDHGETDDGTPYVAMELLEGESLGDRIRRDGPLAIEDAVVVVRQVAEALAAAHRAGIVHRDIKPDNIFLTQPNGSVHVKVLDFGFAKAIQLPDDKGGLTAPGMMVGTPKLVSPDQLLNPTRADPSRDLWALAVVAYHALTGVYPFEGEQLPELLKKILVAEFTPASELRGDLPRSLDGWFLRALARDPAQRFAGAEELATSFAAAAGRGTDDAASEPAPAQVDPADTPETGAPAEAAIVASADRPAALPGIVELCTAELARDPEPHRAARLHHEMAREHERSGALDDAIDAYRRALALAPDHRASLRALRRLLLARRDPAAVELFDAELALVGHRRDRARLHAGKAHALEDVFGMDDAAAEAYARAAELDPSDLGIVLAQARRASRAERWSEAADRLDRIAGALAPGNPLRPILLAEQARIVEQHLGEPDRAEALYESALSLDPALGHATDARMQLLLARSEWRKLAAICESDGANAGDPTVRASTLWLAASIQSIMLDDVGEAKALLALAVEARPDHRFCLEELARACERSGDDAALAGALERLIPLARSEEERAELLRRLARAKESIDPSGAAQCYEKAHESDPRSRETVQRLENLYRTEGRWDALAAALARHAEALDDAAARADVEMRAGRVLEDELGDREAAAKHYARALGLEPERSDAFVALTGIHRALGRFHEVVELHERAVARAVERGDGDDAFTHLMEIAALQERDLHDPSAALATYRRALEHAGGSRAVLHAAERAAEASGQAAALVELLDREAEATADEERRKLIEHRAADVLSGRLGDPEAAIARHRRVLARDPAHGPTLASLESLCRRLGRSDALAEVLEHRLAVAAAGRARAELLLELARAAQSSADRDRALGYLKKALRADKSLAGARRALLDALAARGDRKALLKALAKERDQEADAGTRAALALEMGALSLDQSEAARAAFEQALGEGDSFASEPLARLRGAMGHHEELAQQLERDAEASADRGTAVRKWVGAAVLWSGRMNRPESALRAYEKALALEPRHLPSLFARAMLLRQSEDVGAARIALEALAAATAEGPLKLALLEDRAHLAADPSAAAEAWRAVLELEPRHEGALAALEALALASGDAQLLVEVDRQLAEALVDPVTQAAHLTRLAQNASDSAAARAAFQEALERDAQALAPVRGLVAVAEATGDAQLAADAADREASWTTDAAHGARCLMEAARLRLEQLGDRPGAIAALEQALVRDPESAEAAERLQELLLEAGEQARAVDRLSRAAHACDRDDRRVALWRSVGRLQLDGGDVPAAIVALERARALDPAQLATLMHLAEAYEANTEWRRAADVLEQALSMLPPEWNAAPIVIRLGALYRERLHDEEKALECIDRVLERDGAHREALEMALELRAQRGDVDGARRAAHALLDADQDPRARAAVLARLGKIEHDAGQAEAAAEAWYTAIRLEGTAGAAADLCRRYVLRREGHQRYLEALTEHVERVRRGDLVDEDPGASYLELARISRELAGEDDRALSILRRAARELPDHRTIGMQLVEQLARMGRAREALSELEKRIEREPSHPEPWRLLVRLLQEQGRPAEAALAVAPILLQPTYTEIERNLHARALRARGEVAAGALSAAWLAEAADPAEDVSLGTLFSLLGEPLAKMHPLELAHYGVSSRDRLGPRDEHPLAAACGEIARAFGHERYELYLHERGGLDVSIHADRQPVMIAPAALGSRSPAQQRALLARAFAIFARGLAPAMALSLRELEMIVVAALRTHDPHYGIEQFDEATLAPLSKQLAKALPRRSRKPLAAAAQELAGESIDVAAWKSAVARSANRVAALVAGDLLASLEVLRSLDGDPDDVLAFWGSTRAFSLRRQAGLLADPARMS